MLDREQHDEHAAERRIDGKQILPDEVAVKTFYGGQTPRHASRPAAHIQWRSHVSCEVGVLRVLEDLAAAGAQPACKFPEIAAIRVERVASEPVFQPKRVAERVYKLVIAALHAQAASA